MFNKSLVSIYFLENALLIVELDAKKTAVRKSAIVELPPGIIENYKVANSSSLGSILESSFSKHGITEKAVGIIVPEFSTFSKLVTLPSLQTRELHEAVLWQAQEYLPQGNENMILDWKVVDKSESGTSVLIVAIPKDILKGYIEACEIAGLFPQGVQTPSICLTNLLSDAKEGSLVLYAGFGEAILMVTTKEKILGTSVMRDYENREVIDTASKMMGHFKGVEVKKILICGGGLTEPLLLSIKNELKIPTSILKSGIGGLPESKIQEFVVPISMLTVGVKEPRDPRTINLMPGALIDKYSQRKTKVEIWGLTLTVTLFTWFSFLVVLGSYLVIGQQIQTLKTKNASNVDVIDKIQKYETEAKKINDTSFKVLKVKSIYLVPQEVLNLITNAKPEGVSIENYNMNLDKGIIELSGTSNDRDSLLNFKGNLENTPKVSSVNIPISNFEKISNLEFTLSFLYGATTQDTDASGVNSSLGL